MLLALLLLLLADAPQLRVYTSVVPRGGTVRLTCMIPRHERNREMQFGFEGRMSTRKVEGLDGPGAFVREIQDISCFDTEAICLVRRNDDKVLRATAPLMVIGCENNDNAF